MKYPPEKRRPSTHREKLHRQIGEILDTKYNDPHSGAPYVDTVREADAWYMMLNEADKEWARNLFYSQIQSNELSERDRGDLLDVIGRWDKANAQQFAIHFWKSLPVENYLTLQRRIAYLKYLPYNSEIEAYLKSRFSYWEKKLFLTAQMIAWQYLHSAKDLLQAIANVIAKNSFKAGLSLLPRCILLADRGVLDDYKYLLQLTRSQPFALSRPLEGLTANEVQALRSFLKSQDPLYVEQLKERQLGRSSRAEPLATVIESLHSSSAVDDALAIRQ